MSPMLSPAIDRRRFVALSSGGLIAAAVGMATGAPVWAKPRFGAYPFSLGVASGDPLPDGVVLWTRLAPEPLALDGTGGMPSRTVPVAWQIAEDPQFRGVVRAGSELTTPDFAHTVHADVRGLRPGRDYWYRFRVGNELSPVGRTRTTPASGQPTASMSFAFASCQNYTHGYFTPYAHLAREDLDAVVFLGDYIYEGDTPAGRETVRQHAPDAHLATLADYRVRYAQYKSDEHLQAAHASFPWIVTMDDHEVRNNYWGTDQRPDQVALRTAAYQAFWEHMPLRASSLPAGPQMQVFRRLRFGDLATFHVIDTRQYRDQETTACGLAERTPEGYCAPQLDPGRTILGDRQAGWLLDGLDTSSTRWDILANQMFFTQRDRDLTTGSRQRAFNLGGWDGYVADRQALLDRVAAIGKGNFVVITGDSHQNWVLNTPPTYRDWRAEVAPVATDFMVTSVTSGGERAFAPVFQPDGQNTPHLLYRDNSHGYARVDLTPNLWRTTYRAVSTVSQPTSAVRTDTSWVVERGRPGAVLA